MVIESLERMKKIALVHGILAAEKYLDKPYNLILWDYIYIAIEQLHISLNDIGGCTNAILWKVCMLIDQDTQTLKIHGAN